jgi:hypothetical protein
LLEEAFVGVGARVVVATTVAWRASLIRCHIIGCRGSRFEILDRGGLRRSGRVDHHDGADNDEITGAVSTGRRDKELVEFF